MESRQKLDKLHIGQIAYWTEYSDQSKTGILELTQKVREIMSDLTKYSTELSNIYLPMIQYSSDLNIDQFKDMIALVPDSEPIMLRDGIFKLEIGVDEIGAAFAMGGAAGGCGDFGRHKQKLYNYYATEQPMWWIMEDDIPIFVAKTQYHHVDRTVKTRLYPKDYYDKSENVKGDGTVMHGLTAVYSRNYVSEHGYFSSGSDSADSNSTDSEYIGSCAAKLFENDSDSDSDSD